MIDVKLSNVIAPHFAEIHRDIKMRGHSEYVLCGGRGSIKSSFAGEEVVLLMKRYPEMHALAVRQVKDTLKDSVYSQIVWAIDMMGLTNEFKCTKNPLEIVYKPTGQTIYFRGADDPYKIKSITPRFGYIGILWFEELDQMRGEESVRSIEQSVLRGGSLFFEFKTFNPPQSAANWANKYIMQTKPNMMVHKSSYLTAPQEWLGQRFLDDAEFLRATNERAYRHEYLGEIVGSGANVFDNLTIRQITDEDRKSFGQIYHGVDWGYYPDPFHYVRCAYNPAQLRLFVFDEYRTWKQGNRETYDALKQRGVTAYDEIIADSAEPKSVADYKDYGFVSIRPAVKGAGSVDYSMKWLQSLKEIIIDPVACPHTAQEFLEYEHERTKDGDVISGYPDAKNHSIDAVRYAMNRVWIRKGE